MTGIFRWFVLASLASVVARAVEAPITSLAFAPDGQSVLASSQAGVVWYSWPELELKKRFEVEMLNVRSLSFSTDGRYLAIGGGNPAENGNVEIYEWPSMIFSKRIGVHEDSVSDVCWLGSSRILSASLDRSIKAWSLSSDSSSQEYQGHSKSVTAICLLNDGKTFVSAGVDQSLRVWNNDTGELIRSLNQHTGPINALALRPPVGGLPMVASAAGDRTIRFWQPTIGRMVRFVRLESEALSLAWLNDGEHIAAACSDGKLRIIDTVEVQVLKELGGIEGWAYSIEVNPIDGAFVIGGTNGQLKRFTSGGLPESD